MQEVKQAPLPGFELVDDGKPQLPSPPLWVVELLRMSMPMGVDVVLTLSVVQSFERRERGGAVE